MIELREINPEVFVATDVVPVVGAGEISFLKRRAAENARRRARICFHKSSEDKLHDMLIAVSRDVYIRPHRHHGKAEAFHIVEGQVDVVLFNDNGSVFDVVAMGDAASGKQFFYRIDRPLFHGFIVRSDFLVFHEAAQGPLDRSQSEQAAWAPSDEDGAGIHRFRDELERKIKEFRSHGN